MSRPTPEQEAALRDRLLFSLNLLYLNGIIDRAVREEGFLRLGVPDGLVRESVLEERPAHRPQKEGHRA